MTQVFPLVVQIAIIRSVSMISFKTDRVMQWNIFIVDMLQSRHYLFRLGKSRSNSYRKISI